MMPARRREQGIPIQILVPLKKKACIGDPVQRPAAAGIGSMTADVKQIVRWGKDLRHGTCNHGSLTAFPKLGYGKVVYGYLKQLGVQLEGQPGPVSQNTNACTGYHALHTTKTQRVQLFHSTPLIFSPHQDFEIVTVAEHRDLVNGVGESGPFKDNGGNALALEQ
jgi:hypothetical protein